MDQGVVTQTDQRETSQAGLFAAPSLPHAA
jgi:hypothetical protein